MFVSSSFPVPSQAMFSVALEGDKDFETCLTIAQTIDGNHFYSLHFYEHLPWRPAWSLSTAVAPYLKRLRVGPVTVPANLYSPVVNARFLAHLNTLAPGAVLGVSRGAYMGEKRAKISEVVKKVRMIVDEYRRISWRSSSEPEVYVGTSGPKLARAAASLDYVKGIVVDNLANPRYAQHLRNIIDETGRKDLQLIARPFTSIGEDMDKLLEALWSYVPELVGDSPMLAAAGINYRDLLAHEPGVEGKMIENLALGGDVDTIVEKAARLIRAGVSHICFGHPLGENPVEAVKMLRERVVPVLVEEFG